MEETKKMKITPNQLCLIALGIISIAFSTASLLSDFAPFGRMSEILMLSLTIIRVVLYDTFNILRLMFLFPQKKRREYIHATTTPVPQQQEEVQIKNPLNWRSSKFRHAAMEILDDSLGTIAAVFAVSGFNANRADEVFPVNDTTVMGLLILLSIVVKSLRLLHEVFIVLHRFRHYKLELPTVAVNSLGILASIISLGHLVVFGLVVLEIVTATDYIWFLPVMHLFILKKDKNAKKTVTKPKNVQQYLYGTS